MKGISGDNPDLPPHSCSGKLSLSGFRSGGREFYAFKGRFRKKGGYMSCFHPSS